MLKRRKIFLGDFILKIINLFLKNKFIFVKINEKRLDKLLIDTLVLDSLYK